jgi:hypothetical protein
VPAGLLAALALEVEHLRLEGGFLALLELVQVLKDYQVPLSDGQ